MFDKLLAGLDGHVKKKGLSDEYRRRVLTELQALGLSLVVARKRGEPYDPAEHARQIQAILQTQPSDLQGSRGVAAEGQVKFGPGEFMREALTILQSFGPRGSSDKP
jgi:hypothetical protein